jgi:hypothetical protein
LLDHFFELGGNGHLCGGDMPGRLVVDDGQPAAALDQEQGVAVATSVQRLFQLGAELCTGQCRDQLTRLHACQTIEDDPFRAGFAHRFVEALRQRPIRMAARVAVDDDQEDTSLALLLGEEFEESQRSCICVIEIVKDHDERCLLGVCVETMRNGIE